MRKLPILIVVMAILAVLMFGTPANAQYGQQSYVVQPGDTLFSIAARFNVSVSELATINKVYDVNAIFVGQVLTLPAPLSSGYTPNYPTQPNYQTQPNYYSGNVYTP